MANSHFIEQWVFDRITELKGSINPNTGKKYTRRQIVDKIRGEGGKVSFDTVARKGPTTAKKSRTEYAKLHPDLKSKLLSSNEPTAQKAVDPEAARIAIARTHSDIPIDEIEQKIDENDSQSIMTDNFERFEGLKKFI